MERLFSIAVKPYYATLTSRKHFMAKKKHMANLTFNQRMLKEKRQRNKNLTIEILLQYGLMRNDKRKQ